MFNLAEFWSLVGLPDQWNRSTGMKLYCWRAKLYSEEAFVIADSQESARQALEATRVPWPSEPKPSRVDGNYELWKAWFHAEYHNYLLDRMLALEEHELVILDPGQVAWAEKD